MEANNTIFTFGKYKGKLVDDILVTDENYLRWCITNLKGKYPNIIKRIEEILPVVSKVDMTELVGEDRTAGGNLLFVDLIPNTCWFKNVRTCIKSSDWDILRKYVYSRANYTCECCNLSTKQLDAHERWHYDAETSVQKLVRIIALCKSCHLSTHYGYARVSDRESEAYDHLKRVRNFNDYECNDHIAEAFDVWRERNSQLWFLDLSLITDNGITLKK